MAEGPNLAAIQKFAAAYLVSWNGLKAEMPNDEKLERYAAYFDETWLDSHFRSHMLNYYRHCGPRTNNHLQGWHNRM